MDLPIYEKMKRISSTPNNFYLNHMQAMINDQWENSTQTGYEVSMQENIGSSVYEITPISIDMAIDLGTGYKKGDDFKMFSHKNISQDTMLGLMYQYSGNYWITINTDKFASPVNTVEVRRCNNVLKWVNVSNGAIIKVPCVVDYELSSPQPQKDKDVIVANNHALIIIQGNDLTRSIKTNQRFILNGKPFKVTGIQSLLNDDVNVVDSTLLYIDMFLDMEQNSDDLVNNIANRFETEYAISIEPTITEQLNGFSGKMVATVTLNDEVVDRDVIWSGNEYVTINNDGTYTLNGSVGDKAKITATLSGNDTLTDVFEITIVDVIADNFDIVINPQFSEVRQNIPMTFTAELYNNGVLESDDVSVDFSGLTDDYYTMNKVGNTFTLYADKISSEPLVLTFSAQIATKTIEVMLKPFF